MKGRVAASGFGLAVLAVLAVGYLNLAGLRSELAVDVVVGIAVLVAVLAALASRRATD